MPSLADVFRALQAMQADGAIEAYAIGGGMAALFYAETTRTYDIDVFALIPASDSLLVTLSGIYAWARQRGFEAQQEHILIHGVPVQFLSANASLEQEAVDRAQLIDYQGLMVPVMRPAYLAIFYVLAGSAKRRERTRALFEAGAVDRQELASLLERHGLRERWQQQGGDLYE